MIIKELELNGKEIKIAGIVHLPFIKRSRDLEKIIEEAEVVAFEGCADAEFCPETLLAFFSIEELMNMNYKYLAKIDPVYLERKRSFNWKIALLMGVGAYTQMKLLFGNFNKEDLYATYGVFVYFLMEILYRLQKFKAVFNATQGMMEKQDKYILMISNFVENLRARVLSSLYSKGLARDIGMAYNVYKLTQKFDSIAVIVGYSHLHPIYILLSNPEKLEKLYKKMEKYYLMKSVPIVIVNRGKIVGMFKI